MPVESDAGLLASRYRAVVKKIRIIYRDGREDSIIRPVDAGPASPEPKTYNSREFEQFTAQYTREIKEVRVITRDGNAAQFFPPGTPEADIWASVVSKEEIEAP